MLGAFPSPGGLAVTPIQPVGLSSGLLRGTVQDLVEVVADKLGLAAFLLFRLFFEAFAEGFGEADGDRSCVVAHAVFTLTLNYAVRQPQNDKIIKKLVVSYFMGYEEA
jgi:hypothetical protein